LKLLKKGPEQSPRYGFKTLLVKSTKAVYNIN